MAVTTADGVTIRFTLASPADVEVAVLDAHDQVVRHLAAGLLGHDPPSPPLQPGLAQTLVWDRKDDYGQPAASGAPSGSVSEPA